MKKYIKQRRKKIKELYQLILNTGFIGDKSLKLNYNQILTDLYIVNNLLHSTYLILKNTETEEEAINNLMKLKDTRGKNIIKDTATAKKIYENRTNLIFFFDRLKKRQTYHNQALLEKEKFSTKTGGGGKNQNDVDKYLNSRANHISDVNKNIDRVFREKASVVNKDLFDNPGAINKLGDTFGAIPGNLTSLSDQLKDEAKDPDNIYDWIFHPIWKLQNIPVFGTLIEIPADLVDTLLNNAIIMVETAYPLIRIFISAAGTTSITAPLAAIPVVGPVVAGSAFNIAIQPFLDWIIPNFLKIVSFFFNISRRDLPSAYINAIDFIPFMENTVHALSGFLLKLNKYINMIYPVTNNIRNFTELTSNMAIKILENPNTLLNIDEFYSDVIKPNRQFIPYIKDLSDEDADKADFIAGMITDNYNEFSKCIEGSLRGNNITACLQSFSLEKLKSQFEKNLAKVK